MCTGLSPRLSHVIETMAGTQRRGDVPKFRRQHFENRQPFRAEHISLGEGLRAAFAHENRGPTPEQAAAIRAEVDFHERRREERQRRLESEQERRRVLVLQDRLAREQRAQEELHVKQRLREEQERSNVLGRKRSASPARRTTSHTYAVASPPYVQVPLPGNLPSAGNPYQGRSSSTSLSRAAEPQIVYGSSSAEGREWYVMEPGVVAKTPVSSSSVGPSPTELYLTQQGVAGEKRNALLETRSAILSSVAMTTPTEPHVLGQGQSAPLPEVQPAWAESGSSTARSQSPHPVPFSAPPPGASVIIVPQQSHNVEERLFASRPSFTLKAARRDSVPQQQPEPQSLLQHQPPPPQPPVRRLQAQPLAGGSFPPEPLAPASQFRPVSQQGSPSPLALQIGRVTPPAAQPAAAQTSPGYNSIPAGIGISFVPDQDGNLLIAHLVPGGPAMMSGQLFVGDRLLSVSGQPIAGKSVPEIIRMILGPKGTEVSTK